MRRSFIAALGFVALLAAGSAFAAPNDLIIDRSHTEVGFSLRHFFNKVHGEFTDFSGSIQYDPENVASSTVEVTIRDTSIFTGNDRRDNHLRTQDFFWTEKYPLITFKSTKVLPAKDKKRFQVAGDLTIRDVTKPVVLDVEVLGIGPVAMGGRPASTQAGFLAKTKIDRKDFGIVWNRTMDQGGVMLGDDVDIELEIAAVTRPPAPSASKTESTDKK
jgi:polyisoprenoid-binding protein YceI